MQQQVYLYCAAHAGAGTETYCRMKDADCITFLQWALPRLGLHWPGFRKVRRQVCKRIERRARQLGFVDAAEYRRYLEAHAAEWDTLAALCTVSISRFFRDRSVFDCLGANVLPVLANAAIERRAAYLECWSVGCASGEETYSLAILWQIMLQARFPGVDLRVLGTDIDARLIERAQTGCYPASSLNELTAAWREQAFEWCTGQYCLRAEYRRGVEFQVQDLLQTLPQRTFDLILCRNLPFTYYGAALAQASRDRIASRLRPGGALAIGSRETLPAGSAFAEWPGCRAVYQIPGNVS